MSAHATLEHAEHAAHAGHGDDHGHDHGSGGGNKIFGLSMAKMFGVTMAIIGVLIAFCSAMVGSERTEFTQSMIRQTQAHANYTAASTKFRFVMLELVKQQARLSAQRDPAGGFSPVERFIELSQDYDRERALSRDVENSYEPMVRSHFEAAEGYEHAQVVAEIGIVLASLAVLLSMRAPWVLSVLLSCICIGMLGRTYLHTHHIVDAQEIKAEHAKEEYDKYRKGHSDADEDKKTIDRLDPDHSMRQRLAAKAKAREEGVPEKTASSESKSETKH
jgi:hypothetical protein